MKKSHHSTPKPVVTDAMSDTDSLSAEELRGRLYHSLRDRGFVDSLKSQLRNKLVTELKQVGLDQSYQPQPQYAEEGSLLHKAANSLVADHMRRCNYDYSYGVFLPESGSAEDKLFTTRDLLQLLNISPQSKLYKHLTAHSADYYKKGFLWQLLCEIAAQHGQSSRDSGAQTDAVKLPPPTSLEEEFRKVDSHYASVSDDHKARGMALEERVLAYQRQLDERSHTEVKLEIARFKENELARMRLEEKERCRQQVEQMRREMERTYQSKSDALLERERHAIERLQKQQEIQERETFAQRQSILDEIDAVRQRESTLNRQDEIANREKHLLEDRMKSREELVKKREDAVRRAEVEYEQKLRDEVQKFKIEEQSRYLQRTTNLEFREAKAKEDQRRLDDDLRDIHVVKDELREKRVHVNELEADLIKARHDLISAQKQGELYSEKLREMVDYQIMKEENAVLKNEAESMKMRLAELGRDNLVERQKQEELLREMSERAGKPTPEVYLLQRELDKLRNELQQERAVSNHQKMQADKRLQDEVDRNQDLLRKYEEQTLQLKEMGREMYDVRQQFHGAKQALNNEVYRKPKSALWNGSQSMCDLDVGPPDLDPGLIRQTEDPELLYTATTHNVHRGYGYANGVVTPAKSEDYSYSMDLVEETKKRLRNLEREAEHLEHNYRNFQLRMTTLPPTNQEEEPFPVAMTSSPARSKVVLTENYGSSPILSGSKQHHPSSERTPVKSSINLRGSGSRPMSSTPSRQSGPGPSDLMTPTKPSREDYATDPLMNASMSTVRSTPPHPEPLPRPAASNKSRPLTMSDLDARPSSPSLVVAGDREHTLQPAAAATGTGSSLDQDPNIRVSPSGEEGTSSKTDVATVSLDTAWKSQQQAEEEAERERRRQQEEEDREYEERRRQREEERRKREEEAWEREQQALAELQGGGQKPDDKSSKPASVEDEKEEDDAEKQNGQDKFGEDNIDPVMLSYMAKLKEQKEKEKQTGDKIMQQTVDTWTRGRKERTPSPSEEISVGDDEKSKSSKGGGGGSDEDFW